eukprot:1846515-Pyramimonas_sp.AAC.1
MNPWYHFQRKGALMFKIKLHLGVCLELRNRHLGAQRKAEEGPVVAALQPAPELQKGRELVRELRHEVSVGELDLEPGVRGSGPGEVACVRVEEHQVLPGDEGGHVGEV